MDRRAGRRAEPDLKALVFRRGLAILVGRVQALGLLGMYLRIERPALPKHTLVEVGFSVGRPGASRFVRFPAMVARSDSGGMGLVFDADDAATRASLRTLLHAWRSDA